MRRSRLAISLSLLLIGSQAANAASRFEYDPTMWVLCRPNSLLDFYQPNLGKPEDRETSPTTVQAMGFDIRDQESYLLEGDVEIVRADQRIAADAMRYNPQEESWRVEGELHYQDASMMMEAQSASGLLEKGEASLEALRYQLLRARGNGEAEKAFNNGTTSELHGVTYTTCDPDHRQWSIRANRVDINEEQGMATTRGGTLRLGNVPVLYFPIATFPIDDRRKSGFLFPSIGASRTRGLDLEVPYYLNLAPNFDATFTPRLMTKRGVMLGGQFRYLTENHRGEVQASWLPNDSESDRDRGTFTWEHRGKLSNHWQLISDINHISDDRYFEDFGDSLSTAATSLLESSAGLYGRGQHWTASVAVQGWTIADPHTPDHAEPFRRLPRSTFTWEKPLGGDLVAGLRSEAVVFEHSQRAGASRIDAHPYLGWNYERAAGFFRPEIGVRHTQYQLDSDYRDAFTDKTPTRTTPIYSLDTGLVFERPVTLFNTSLLQTLEPRLHYLNVPYRNQDDIPIFDTQELGFSWGQLFRSNRFAGADRQSDANQATFAVTTRFFDEDNGSERVSASLGQIRYFQAQRVQMPGVSELDREGSAYVADVAVQLDDRWNVAVSQQWDPEDDISNLSTLRSQYRWGEAGVFNFAYRFRRDARTGATPRVALEQFDTSVLIPLNAQWRLVGRWNYSLVENTTLEAVGGVEWENCCIATRILARRYVRNFESDRNTSLYVELELKGLSTLGRKSGDLLERAILGYSR